MDLTYEKTSFSLIVPQSMWTVVNKIGSETRQQPLCYMVNCSYPTFLRAKAQPNEHFTRPLGYQADSYALNHIDLDCSTQLRSGIVARWAEEMLDLSRIYGEKIFGGCSGTNESYLKYLVKTVLG
jgi:hypothetical protein